MERQSSKTTARALFALTAFGVAAASTLAHAGVQQWRMREIYSALQKKRAARTGMQNLVAPSLAPQFAEIESLTLDPACAANDNWCGGTLVVDGQTVTIPRNLIIDLPASRLTLRQLFDQAPPACVVAKQSGLARNDTCRLTTKGFTAALSANHDSCGKIIAGDLFILPGPEILTGPVTFINYTDGYFRISGTVGADAGGTMVRLNDPTGRNTIQQGQGCLIGSTNCSPDPRFTSDPDNYTASFLTGYPLCIPSQVVNAGHATAADANGVGDPLCPDTNRTGAIAPNFMVPDSRLFAPLKLGDTVTATGGMVTVGAINGVGGVTFLMAHTIADQLGLSTREAADQPDYVRLDKVQWKLAPFPEPQVVAVFTGFTTLSDSQQDIFADRVDPTDNSSHLDPLTSTVGNPRDVNKLVAGPGGKFQTQLQIQFLKTVPVAPGTSACAHLINAGFSACPNGSTMDEEVSLLNPPSREITSITRRTVPLAAGTFAVDILNRQVNSGQWTQPLGVNLGGLLIPDPGEGNLGLASGPQILEALPWTLDRRTSPSGCLDTGCENTAQPLDPYPVSRVNLLNAVAANGFPAASTGRVLTFFTFEGGALVPHVLSPTPVDSCALPVFWN